MPSRSMRIRRPRITSRCWWTSTTADMHRATDPKRMAIEFAIAGAALALMGAYNIFRGWSTGSWKPVPGEITEAYLTEEEREDDDFDSSYAGTVTAYFRSRI